MFAGRISSPSDGAGRAGKTVTIGNRATSCFASAFTCIAVRVRGSQPATNAAPRTITMTNKIVEILRADGYSAGRAGAFAFGAVVVSLWTVGVLIMFSSVTPSPVLEDHR